jgi:hypothetical protein
MEVRSGQGSYIGLEKDLEKFRSLYIGPYYHRPPSALDIICSEAARGSKVHSEILSLISFFFKKQNI